MTHGRTTHGFTLVEMLVVLTLISIFSSLVVVEMRGTHEDALLRAAARKLISAANLAGSHAVTLNVAHGLSIDLARKQFVVRALAPPEDTDGEEVSALPVEEGELDSRISIALQDTAQPADDEMPAEKEERNRDLIAFYPDGTADGREILLRDRLGVELLLRISASNGRIHIVAPEAEVPR